MVFSSTIFIFGFLPIVLLGNILLRKCTKVQNIFLLLMSLLFYAWGEPRTVFLMIVSIILNWGVAILIDKCEKRRNKVLLLLVSIAFNLGTLFVFKYFTWSVGIFNQIFHSSFVFREIVLPIGISFYTFQSLSYVVDVYRGTAKASRSLVGVGLYISFFHSWLQGRLSDIPT